MARQGILLGDDGDLLTANGSLQIGKVDDQNVSNLITASKCEIKENPVLGVGLINYLKKQNTSLEGLKREISINLQADGYKVKSFSISNTGEFNLDYELK